MKRLGIGLLSIALLLSMFCLPTAAQERDGFIYDVLSDGTARLTAYTGSEQVLILPEKVDGLTVSAIGERAFADLDHVIIVNIPEAIDTVGEGAFAGCDSLRQAEIPKSLSRISKNMFENCSSLKTVYLPTTLTSVGEGAFAGCTSLANVYYGGYDVRSWNAVVVEDHNEELFGATLHYEPYPYTIGDVTKDGVLDMRDAFQTYIWASQGSLPEDMMELADVTQDGRFDMRDAFYHYNFVSSVGGSM